MVHSLLGIILFATGSPGFVPQEIKCAVPKIISSIENSKDMNVLLDAWADLPNQCVEGGCCIDTSESQTEEDGYNWECGKWAWEMRPSIFNENDSTCWAEYVISFRTPLDYSTNHFVRDFSFIPRGSKAGWMRGKEYASYSFYMPNEDVHASGWLSGRIGRLKFMNKNPLPCIKREYKFHSGDSLVFCAKPKSDSGAPSK